MLFRSDDGARKLVADLRDYLKGLPTQYFEMKAQRAMPLDELPAFRNRFGICRQNARPMRNCMRVCPVKIMCVCPNGQICLKQTDPKIAN